jgi:hypothetical protein
MMIERRGTIVTKERAMQRPVRKRFRNSRVQDVLVPFSVKKFGGVKELEFIGSSFI